MEDSQQDTQELTENERLLEEMLRDAESLPQRGPEVIHRGDEQRPPMVITRVDSAGVVPIYDTLTGEPGKCLKNLLPVMLRKTREDGTYVWTTKKPAIPWKAGGDYKCLLHADDPNRKHYDELGLPTCRKANLTSPYQVERHMKKRHKTAWETVEKERLQAEKEEERSFQQSLLKQVAAARGEKPKPKRKKKA